MFRMSDWPSGVFVSEIPTRAELKKLHIKHLVSLAKSKRSIKHPFKKYLIDYILKIYYPNETILKNIQGFS
jgi:hypothetical protein